MIKYNYELTGEDRMLTVENREVVIEALDYDTETEMVIVGGYYDDNGDDFYAELDADGSVRVS